MQNTTTVLLCKFSQGKESFLLLYSKIIPEEKHLPGIKSPPRDMIPQCLMFMGLVPTLQGPWEAALAIQTATTINTTQCRISVT